MKKNKKNPLQKVGIRYKERETISRERKLLSQLEEKCGKLEKMNGELLEELAEKVVSEATEKNLKNEAYAFLLSEGLVDKFLNFREIYQRTKSQEVYLRLVQIADLEECWLEP